MPTVTQSLEIPAAPEQVWAVATDMSRYGEWNVTHTGFPEGSPAAEPGATFKETITIMGMPGEASWTVTEANPPTLTVWAGEGPMGIRLGTRLELWPPATEPPSVSRSASMVARWQDRWAIRSRSPLRRARWNRWRG